MSIWEFLFGSNVTVRTRTNIRNTIDPTYQTYQYRTKDGVAYFSFSYAWVGSFYEIDIHTYPSYEKRPCDSHTAHWLPLYNRKAARKICIYPSKAPKTLQAAQTLSVQWAELTWEYIKTGVSIDAQIDLQHKSN